MEFLYPFEDEF